jgi:hypothetical protein
MIKFTGENENKEPVLGLGLSGENWRLLLAGKPITIKPSEMGLPWPGEIFIMGGATEQSMTYELSKLGVLRDVPVRHFDETEEQK